MNNDSNSDDIPRCILKWEETEFLKDLNFSGGEQE